VVSKKINAAQSNEEQQRQQFGHGKHVAELRARIHTRVIGRSQYPDERAQHNHPRDGCLGVQPELRQVNDKEVGIGGRGSKPDQPGKPAHHDTGEPPEGNAGVEVGAAGLNEARGHLRETPHDDAAESGRSQPGHRSGSAQLTGNQ
jgi:hypothetical protein